MTNLFTQDQVFSDLARQVEKQFGTLAPLEPLPTDRYFERLIESIVSQQLSVKVADVIFARLEAELKEITPEKILEHPAEKLRTLGLSHAKIAYSKNLASAWQSDLLDYPDWHKLANEEIVAKLIQVKGIGQWTAEMFLIFTMARPDVFSLGDYGLRTAVIRAYGLPAKVHVREISVIAEKWAPQRSLASRILWKSLELK